VNRILPLVLLVLVSASAGFYLYRGMFDRPPPQLDTLPTVAAPRAAAFAPDFVLPDLAGRQRSSSEWHGTIRVVNFWATWCPPCLREIPLLVEIQDEYLERDVRVIGIAIDDHEAVAEFAAQLEFNYPVLIGQDEAMDLGNLFLEGFIGLPFTAFMDRRGRILRVHTGEIHREQIESILAELL
jgi:thiol-disulfide isomerase/thioredoxin